MARKNVAFKIRINEELRRASVDACRKQDRATVKVVREIKRRYVAGETDFAAQSLQSKVSMRNMKQYHKTRG